MLRTRPPRSTPERVRARLACIRHAASVDPEPGSNSPPMLQSPEAASVDAEARHRRADRHRVAASCLRVDGHARVLAGLLLWASRMRSWPQPGSRKSPHRASTLRSLRLRHTTRCPAAPVPQRPAPHPSAAPACQRAAPRAVTTSARPMRHLPLHPLHPAARSTLGGRSSPEPAKPTVAPATLSRVGHGAIALCVPSEGTRQRTVSGLPGDAPRRIHQLREPHQFTTTPLLCQVGCRWVALRAPARSTAMDPCEQDDYCTRMARLCQVYW